MNQLAKAIRNLSDDRKGIETPNLTPLEITALKSISCMFSMLPVELETYLKQDGEPTEWLIIPPVITFTEEIDWNKLIR